MGKGFFFSILVALVQFFCTPLAAAENKGEVFPVVVLGGGVGGLTSALYLARSGHQPLVIEGKNPGGLLTQSHSVQNWPGEMEIAGAALIEKMRTQAAANHVRFAQEEVVAVDFAQRPFVITTQPAIASKKQERRLLADACIIAMGTTPNFLQIPGEQTYWGRGVTNCAICDGSAYQDGIVGVVGGGDAAVLEALYLAQIAKEVHVFVRKGQFRASDKSRVALLLKTPNIHVHYQTEVKEIQGNEQQVERVLLQTQEGTKPFPLDGLFLAIGSRPNTALLKNAVKLDKNGYILLRNDQETSVKGVYAIGDIADPVYKQAITASGDGARAAMQAQRFLMDRPSARAQPIAQQRKDKASTVIEIQSVEQFKKEIETADALVIVDFYATWCAPCTQIASLLERSAAQLSGKVKFLKVNVDTLRELSKLHHVRAMPTVLLLNASGKELDRKIGADQISILLEQLEARPVGQQ